ncbi:hypothetical protein D3C71_1519450 [compost metagenome]
MDQQAHHDRRADGDRMRGIHQHEEDERPDHAQDGTGQIHRAPADLVRQMPAQRHGNRIQRGAQHGGGQGHGPRQVQHRRHIGQREHDHQRVKHVRADAGTAGDQQLPPVLAQHFLDGRAGGFALFLHLQEHGRFLDAAAQPQAEQHQRHAGDERHAPAPGLEVFRAQEGRYHGDEAGADQRAARRPHLRERRIASALVRLAVLHRQQHGARPFPAQGHALHEAQRHQRHRRPHAP